jgi:hypothetical protein
MWHSPASVHDHERECQTAHVQICAKLCKATKKTARNNRAMLRSSAANAISIELIEKSRLSVDTSWLDHGCNMGKPMVSCYWRLRLQLGNR